MNNNFNNLPLTNKLERLKEELKTAPKNKKPAIKKQYNQLKNTLKKSNPLGFQIFGRNKTRLQRQKAKEKTDKQRAEYRAKEDAKKAQEYEKYLEKSLREKMKREKESEEERADALKKKELKEIINRARRMYPSSFATGSSVGSH